MRTLEGNRRSLRSMLVLLSGTAVLSISCSLVASQTFLWGAELTASTHPSVPQALGSSGNNGGDVPEGASMSLTSKTTPTQGASTTRMASSPPESDNRAMGPVTTTPAATSEAQREPTLKESRPLSVELERLSTELQDAWHKLDEPSFREQPNVLQGSQWNTTGSTFDITLTTFVTMDQLDLLKGLASRWVGPLSIAAYLANASEVPNLLSFVQENSRLLQNTTWHVLLEKPDATTTGMPMNRLRNLALDHMYSDYCLLMDVEFVPNPGIYPHLLHVLHTNYRVRAVLNEQKLLALPAFENVNGSSSLAQTPQNKKELVGRLADKSVALSPMPNTSLVATAMDYDMWKRPIPGSMYVTEWRVGYEPFLLARRQGLPSFWPGFRWPAARYAKQCWFEELYERFYTIGMLREHFAFRVASTSSSPSVELRVHADEEYKAFRQYVHDTYVRDPTLTTNVAFDAMQNGTACDLSKLLVSMNASLEFVETERALLCEWVDFSASPDYRRQYPWILGGKNTTRFISLALHGSVDRLDRLVDGIQRWNGPTSVALYAKNAEAIVQFFQLYRQHSNMFGNATFHFFFEKINSEHDEMYPHNYLRNLAMEHSNAEHIIVCDMDFVTNQDAYSELVRLLKDDEKVLSSLQNGTVLVLPAFESTKQVVEQDVAVTPSHKAELLRTVEEKVAEPFHLHKYSAGHGPTNFTKWMAGDIPPMYDIEYEWGFEPYVLSRRVGLPKFWTRFRGFGRNKQTWCEEVSRMGYKFAVLRDFFVFHVGRSSQMVETPEWVHREYQRRFRPRLDRLYPAM